MTHRRHITFSSAVVSLALAFEARGNVDTQAPDCPAGHVCVPIASDAQIQPEGPRAPEAGHQSQAEATEMHSESMTVAGCVITGLGVLFGVTGGALLGYSFSDVDSHSGALTRVIGPALMGTAGALFAVGIPLIAVGAHQVPLEPPRGSAGAGSLFLQVGPAAVVLTGTF